MKNKLILLTMVLFTSISLNNCNNLKNQKADLDYKIEEAKQVISILNKDVAKQHAADVLKTVVAIVKAKSNPLNIQADKEVLEDAKTIIKNAKSDKEAIDTAIKAVKEENLRKNPAVNIDKK